MVIADTLNKFLQFHIHCVDIFGAHREVICRIIFIFLADADALYADLKCSLKAGDIAVYVYVIQGIVVSDSLTVGLPDLCIYGAGFVLQNDIFICLAVLGHGSLFMLAQINPGDGIALSPILDIFHFSLFLLANSID
jgi:hypothetical protein